MLRGDRQYPAMPRVLLPIILAILTASTATAAGSSPKHLMKAGNRLTFVAEGGLWGTDGTRAGTVRLIDVPSTAGFVSDGEAIYFNENSRLWRSDGTPEGTIKLAEPARCGTPSFVMGPVKGRTFVHCEGLWSTDGTPEGTRKVTIPAMTNDPGRPSWVLFDGALFFSGSGAIHRSDGTADGTTLAVNKAAGNLFTFKDALFFMAEGALWRMDKSGALEQILPLAYQPDGIYIAVGATAFYIAGERNTSWVPTEPTVWKSDGTAAGTKPVGNFSWREGVTYTAVVTANGHLVFRDLSEVWRANGSPDGPQPIAEHVMPEELVPLNGFAVISGDNDPLGDGATYSRELWISDGTAEGTRLVRDINPGGNRQANVASSAPMFLTPVGDVVYFTADDGRTGRELWRTDGTTRGTYLVANLAREGLIEGRVRDAETGAPLAGVLVQTWSGSTLFSETPTDSAGRFWSEGLGNETYTLLTLNTSGYIDRLGDDLRFAAGATGVEISLSKGGRISGRVTDAATGAGISAAAVSIFNASNRLVASAVSDASGAYVSDGGLQAGNYRIEVTHPQFNKGVVQSGIATGADVVLTRAGEVRGRVIDETSGRPVPFMNVTVFDAERKLSFFGVTAADGTYRVPVANGTYTVSVSREEFPQRYTAQEHSSRVAVASNESKTVDFALKRAVPFIEGRVFDAVTGAPIHGAYVTAKHTTQQNSNSEYTNAEGWFSLQQLAWGTHTVGAYHPHYEQVTLESTVTVGQGTSVGGLEIRMRRRASLRGRVVDAQGRPVAGAWISVCGSCNIVARTGGTGTFHARDTITAGTFSVRVNANGFSETSVSNVVVTAATETDLGAIALSRPYRVSGRVFDAQTGKAIAGARLIARDNLVATTALDGTFAFTDTTDRPFVLTALAEGFATQRYPGIDCNSCGDRGTTFTPAFDVSREGIDFAMHRATYITGRVTDAETGETVDASVATLDESFRGAGTSARTGPNGVYKSEKQLGHGKFHVVADARPTYLLQYWSNASCEVEPGTNPCRFPAGVAPKTIESRGFPLEGIDFALQPRMVDVTFDVLDAVTRAPVAGATVELFTQSAIPLYRSGLSDVQGEVRMRVSARVFWARVSAPGYASTIDNAACGNACVVHAQLATFDALRGSATLLLHRVAIHEIRPRAGFASGGKRITIRGEGFQHGAAVTFEAVAAQVVSITPTEIVVTTPAGNIGGNSAIAVTNPDGRQAKADGNRGFRYLPDAPCVPLDVNAWQVLHGSTWAINMNVNAGGPTVNEMLISSPGRPTIVPFGSTALLNLQDVERYATLRVTSGCEEREFVFRLDKKKVRSVR
jgi:ELWxxDGT repeat protein